MVKQKILFYGQLLIKHKLLYFQIITLIILNFHHVLVLISTFEKYYGLSHNYFKPYSRSWRAVSKMKYQKPGMKDILFSFYLVKK